MVKVAIVGPEESKWDKEQKHRVNVWIESILRFPYIGTSLKNKISVKINVDRRIKPKVDNILISGHCPKGGVDIWAEEIADFLGIKKIIFKPEVNKWNDSKMKCNLCHGTGIQDMGYCKTGNEWIHREKECDNYDCKNGWQQLKGYRSRNIEIAKECDILYCIVPKRITGKVMFNRDLKCIHCNEDGHPTNGGCWTMNYAKKLGKEIHLVIV